MGTINGSVISCKLKSQWPDNLMRSLSWRILPVLIAISLLVSMAVLVFPSPASAEHEGEQTAGFLPSETQLYLTVNLDPGEDNLTGLWSVINNWWQDPNFRASWDEWMDERESEVTFNFEDDILPWLGPELAVASRSIPVQEDSEPEILIFIGTMDKELSDTFFKEKFIPEVTDETGTSGDYEGIETLYFSGDDTYCAFTSDYIIISSQQTFLENTLDIILDSSLPSLADDANFKQARSALPEARAGMLYGNLVSVLDEIDQQSEFGIADIIPSYFATSIKFDGAGITGTGYYPLPEAISFSPSQSALLEVAGIVPEDALYVASMDENACWTAATAYLQALWGELTEASSVELTEAIAQIELAWDENISPVLGELAELTLEEAALYLDSNFNLELEAAWENIKAGMGDFSEMTLAEALAYLNDDLGLGGIWGLGIAPLLDGMSSAESFEDAMAYLIGAMPDLLLLSESAVALLPPPSLEEEVPDILFISEASDVAQVQVYLDVVTGVMKSINPELVSSSSIGGVDATLIGDGGSVEMGYLFLDVDGTDYLVIGSTVDSLEAVVNAQKDPAKSLSQTEEYKGLSFQIGEIRGSFMYLNLTRLLELGASSADPSDEEMNWLLDYIPLKSAIGYTNSILGEDGITMSGALYLLPPPLIDQEIEEGFSGLFIIPERSFDLSFINSILGQAAVQIDVDIPDGAPAGASVKVATMADPGADMLSRFESAANDAGFSIDDIAYVVKVEKVNIEDEDLGTATITLKVGKAWVDEYGVDDIQILRIGDDGTQEILSMVFKGYNDDNDQAIFEGTSENGLSYFGLAAVSEGGDGTNWALIGGIIGGVVVVLAIATLILLRRRSQTASLTS